jgi:hypothetical protein
MLDESKRMEWRLFFAPGFFVDIWKRDFAVAGVDAIDSCLALRIKITLLCRTVRKLDLVGLAGDRLAGFIEQFDFNPVACLGSGRTCRLG